MSKDDDPVTQVIRKLSIRPHLKRARDRLQRKIRRQGRGEAIFDVMIRFAVAPDGSRRLVVAFDEPYAFQNIESREVVRAEVVELYEPAAMGAGLEVRVRNALEPEGGRRGTLIRRFAPKARVGKFLKIVADLVLDMDMRNLLLLL